MISATDPNWLYSSTAQSTAALVAIVGGFIVSRVISLSSDRAGFLRRLQEATSMLAMADQEAEAIAREVYSTAYTWFREHRLRRYFDLAGQPEEPFTPRGASENDLLRMQQELDAEVALATRLLEERYAAPEIPPSDLIHLKSDGIVTDAVHDDVLEFVAQGIAQSRRPVGGFSALGDLTRYSTALLSTSEVALRRHDAAIVRRDDQRAKVRQLEAEIRLVQHELTLLGQPRGLNGAFVVLAAFSAFGLLLPLALMAARPVPDATWVRALVVAGFVFGLASLFYYMFYQARVLRGGPSGTAANVPSD
ncbi:MAG: hypothetical protein ACYC3W_04415 [Candidatus Nanopelagicales bacterium]